MSTIRKGAELDSPGQFDNKDGKTDRPRCKDSHYFRQSLVYEGDNTMTGRTRT